jgi:hypothetical protein
MVAAHSSFMNEMVVETAAKDATVMIRCGTMACFMVLEE